MVELQNPKNWKRTHKKQYEVYMCRPIIGTECQNMLEGAKYVTDKNKQFILSGTVGENWIIDVNKLAKTYTFEDGTPITPDTLRAKCRNDGQIDWVKLKTRSDALTNWAFHLPNSIQNFPVQTSWGDTLFANRSGVAHLMGDFLVCSDAGGQPNFSDVWVVNGEIFPRTYDLHAFPNMFTQYITSSDTIKPQRSFIKNDTSFEYVNRGELNKNAGELIARGMYRLFMNTFSKHGYQVKHYTDDGTHYIDVYCKNYERLTGPNQVYLTIPVEADGRILTGAIFDDDCAIEEVWVPDGFDGRRKDWELSIAEIRKKLDNYSNNVQI